MKAGDGHGISWTGGRGDVWSGEQPEGLNVISAKRVFAGKSNENDDVVREKARLVTLGFKQREGIVFFETFAPTPAASCFHLLGAIACEVGLDLCRFDAEQAFVQSSLEENVFMRLPPGCGKMSGKEARLTRSLSGLKQASRSWYNHLLAHMKSLRFGQSSADACHEVGGVGLCLHSNSGSCG